MDHINHSRIQSYNHNKVIKFLLSVSVLISIILSQSSSIRFLLHSFHAFISSPSVKWFSYSFDKNYMFLLCNGLLVFIVKNSGLIGSSPPESNLNNDELPAGKNRESLQRVVELTETKAPKAMEEVISVEVEKEQGREEEEEEEEEEDEILVTVGGDKRVFITQDIEEEEGYKSGFVIVEDDHEYEEEGEGEGTGLLSTEELNKKCDDFIRKMKEGIKLEVQQSMIMF